MNSATFLKMAILLFAALCETAPSRVGSSSHGGLRETEPKPLPSRGVSQSDRGLTSRVSERVGVVSAPIPSSPPKDSTGVDTGLGEPDSEANAPPADQGWQAILVTFVLGVLAAVLSALLYDRIKRRVRVVPIYSNHATTIAEIHSLYLQRVDPSDRVSPSYITHFTETPHTSLRSTRRFLAAAKNDSLPELVHILFAARSHGRVVGLLKALYVRSAMLLFIAYVAVQAEDSYLEGRTMRELLSRLQRIAGPNGPVKWIAFEITESRSASARERLFRQHAQSLDVHLRRVDLDYLQPDLDCTDLKNCNEESAMLYVGSPGGTPDFISIRTLREILDAIYVKIYLPTWLIDHSEEEAAALEEYVRDLSELLVQDAPTRVRLL